VIDILAETLQKLSARRGLVARELATLDEAIAALQRVHDEAPKHALAAVRPMPPSTSKATPSAPPPPPPGPRRCALKSCAKVLPPPVRNGGRPRIYCDKSCARRAADERNTPSAPPPTASRTAPTRPAPAEDDGEDPTDRALRQHRELHRLPESGSGYRARGRGRA
jgi:hypothetical protein